MNLLFILQYVPYPLDSGGNQAMFNMIDEVRRQHNVSIICNIKSEKESLDLQELQKIWENVNFYIFKGEEPTRQKEIEYRNKPFAKSRYRLLCSIKNSIERKMRRLIRQNNQSVSPISTDFVRENSTLFSTANKLNDGFLLFIQEIASKGFDAIQTEFYEMLPLVYILPQHVTKIFVHHEIRYIRNRNEMNLFQKVKLSDLQLYYEQKAAELDALSRYDRVITLTEIDKQLLLQERPDMNIYVSPAAVSVSVNKEIPFKPAKDLVFVGNGFHFPNAEGLLWFCEAIYPLLKKAKNIPNMYVVGIWSDAIKKRVRNIAPEVRFTGFVDNLMLFLNGKISVVPIRIGSGMRMKILESISANSPIVTTYKGCEGLPLNPGKDCFVDDTAEDFANAILTLLADCHLQQQFALQMKKTFSTLFNKEELLHKRLDFYNNL